MVMKNVVGSPARGDNFFNRDREISKILRSIGNGNNIQIAAPRRVGKTSILFHMLDKGVEGYKYVYVDTESIDSEEDFYKKLLKEIVKLPGLQSAAVKFLKTAGLLARKIKSVKVMEVGVDIQDEQGAVSYYEDLTHFLSGIQLDAGEQLILLIDEFPQTIRNILSSLGINAANRFLQSNRALRLHPDIVNKVRFIYTGSIGLNHTVAAIDSTAFINDLNTLEVEPLRREEAGLLLEGLLGARGVIIEPSARDYLLKKLEWLIPFHIQLLVQELLILNLPDGSINFGDIDRAFEEIIAARNENHFSHYFSRLMMQFNEDKEIKYVLTILRTLAESGAISRKELLEQAAVFDVIERSRNIIEILVYDGYINNAGDKAIYRFNSPVVRNWWYKYVF